MTGDANTPGGITQACPRPGITDLGPGYLDPALIPAGLIRRWAGMAIDQWGTAALSYGADEGPAVLRQFIADRMSDGGAGHCGAQNVLVTAGTSAALDRLAADLALAGTVVLTESLSYDLGRLIFTTRGVRTVEVPGPADDVDVAELRRAARTVLDSTGRPPAFYLIPTFHNPTGRVLSAARRQEILALADELEALVIEDQAYADLSYDGLPPPPLWQLTQRPDLVISLYSLAKCLAPGLRLGWLVSADAVVARLAASGERRSGGGPNHFTAMALAAGCAAGEFGPHVAGLSDALRLRRDAFAGALGPELPAGFDLVRPAGGFFCWVSLPPGADDRELLARAERRGVSFAAGSRFGSSARGIRLCFAAAGVDDLRAAASEVAGAAREVCGPG